MDFKNQAMAGAAQLTLVPGVMPEKKTDRRSSHRDNAPMKSSRIFSIGIVVQWTGPKYNYTAPVSSFVSEVQTDVYVKLNSISTLIIIQISRQK
ncbi:uncharacterized protein LOC112691167 isoform X2 [Sipha flava]|uniref:Uncharacterized protein LOC112691167 isoform X2 n=1 Tax=Sipha flava TaxID=143950 RepID=A0A8B8GD00_9HEMI|nr:uncharacterized protein LOC112691167 isoform X2 [Sipha flava]